MPDGISFNLKFSFYSNQRRKEVMPRTTIIERHAGNENLSSASPKQPA